MDIQKSGICIVAIGHPYYGRMAFNLAKSIKAIDRDCPIQVICSDSAMRHISNKDMWVFDYLTYTAIENGFECKLHVNNISLFENTLLLDADCAWVNKQSPLSLISLLGECPFTGITEGMYDAECPEKSDVAKKYYFWADIEEIIKEYEIKHPIYQWRSEFLYFHKCELSENVFEFARSVYAEAKTRLKTLKLFANNVPDELAFNIACAVHGIKPHKYKWQPSFWSRLHNDNTPTPDTLCVQYFTISCGSNINTMNVRKAYDRAVKAASYKLGMQHVFPLISKKEMITSRQQM